MDSGFTIRIGVDPCPDVLNASYPDLDDSRDLLLEYRLVHTLKAIRVEYIRITPGIGIISLSVLWDDKYSSSYDFAVTPCTLETRVLLDLSFPLRS